MIWRQKNMFIQKLSLVHTTVTRILSSHPTRKSVPKAKTNILSLARFSVKCRKSMQSIRNRFRFALLCDWFKRLAPPNQPIRCKTNHDLVTRFPGLGAGYVYLLRVLIGSLRCLRLLWLVIVTVLVLVLQNSIENCSNITPLLLLPNISACRSKMMCPSPVNQSWYAPPPVTHLATHLVSVQSSVVPHSAATESHQGIPW